MTTGTKSSIAVIVVNYGTADLALAAVDSVLTRNHGGHPVEVHLVDNASPGDDAATIAQAHDARGWGDRVTLWLERENHGFGRGNDVVLKALAQRPAPPDYAFLLNPDATLANEALAILADAMDADPRIAAAGASIERDNGRRVTAAFRFPSAASEFAAAVGIRPISRFFDGTEVALPPDQPRGPVDWVSGASVMFRVSAARAAGFFDPDFFLYYEETELQWRLHQAGGTIWFVPEARVGHVSGAATGMQEGKARNRAQPGYWYDSWRLYFVKTRGVGGARKAALAKYFGSALNAVIRRLTGRAPDAVDRFGPDFRRHVLRPLFFGDPLEARPDGRTPKAAWLKRNDA